MSPLRPTLRACLVAVCLGSAACGDSAYAGSWEVIDFKRPGISVMGNQEASMWLGVTLEIEDDAATMVGETCAIGEVRRETLPVRDIEMSFGLIPGELELSRESVDLYQLECTDGDLGAGRQLIRLGRDTLLTPWEGVFFVLERRREGRGGDDP